MKNQKNLNNSKLIAYSAVAGAALAVAPNAIAKVIHQTVDIPFGQDQGGSKFLIMEGSEAEFGFHGFASTDCIYLHYANNIQGGYARVFNFPDGSFSDLVSDLASTKYVSFSSNIPAGQYGYFLDRGGKGNWTSDGETHKFGVSFRIEGSGDTVYGWIEVERLTSTAGKITQWAYEDTGDKIQVGALPEPATGLALLALGAAGIAAYRRK